MLHRRIAMSDDYGSELFKTEELVANETPPGSISFELTAYQESLGRPAAGMDEVRQSMDKQRTCKIITLMTGKFEKEHIFIMIKKRPR